MTTLQNPTEVKAIKAHCCDFCSESIRIGQVYLKSVHKRDTVYSWKTHKYCGELADKMKLYEDARDCGYEGVDGDFFMESVSSLHDDLLTGMLPAAIVPEDVYQQLRHVSWHYKLWYVIRHFNNLSKTKN